MDIFGSFRTGLYLAKAKFAEEGTFFWQTDCSKRIWSKLLEGSAIFVSILSPQVTMANVLWLNSPFKVGCNNYCNAIVNNCLTMVLHEIAATSLDLGIPHARHCNPLVIRNRSRV